jgi:mannose/cellobiose epimerase-like protein (N-acyl-D-glucosamine 2-epimerase family)
MSEADPIPFDRVRRWITDAALPLWTRAGVDLAHGGAVEALDFNGADAALPYKRVRAQARQAYAFTHGQLAGWTGDGARCADHVWSFLQDKARRADGGWVRRLNRDGSVLDPVADAYDTAFILFALAWRARGGDEGAMGQAHGVLDALERILGFPDGLGFHAAEDKRGQRLQNPHMHLLEASLELADAGGDDRFADLASRIVDMFADRMFDRSRGVLVETFGEGWRPLVGDDQKIEPGHLYEWSWLLQRAEAVTGRRLHDEARALCGYAEAHGLQQPSHFVEDALHGPNLRRSGTYRIWPLAEALKAHLALFEHQNVDDCGRIAEVTSILLDRYLAPPPAGGWIDQFDADGRPISPNIPSSILYHLLVAFSELLRLQPRLQARRTEVQQVPSPNFTR